MQRKLVVSDLSNIEGRILAYLAGEEWKLQAFRDYDAGIGPDLYNITAVSIIGGDPYAVSKPNRNAFGKVPDLFGGYEGGVGAAQTFAKAYNVRMSDHWDTIQENTDKKYIAKARENYASWGKAKAEEMEIDEREWVACETVKLAWRARHPATVQLWRDTKDAAMTAIREPGKVFSAGPHLKFSVRRKAGIPYLLAKLPSGRYMVYCRPRLDGEGRDIRISYEGTFRRTPTSPPIWARVHTYGGKLIENCTQSLARDVLAYNMPAVEAAGYRIILTVHDEIIGESDKDEVELSAIMATVPPWAEGLPLAAAGFTADRYKKD